MFRGLNKSCFLIQFLEQLLKFLANLLCLNKLSLRELQLFNYKRADFSASKFWIFLSVFSLLKGNQFSIGDSLYNCFVHDLITLLVK